jgi:benzodiazapine receptor
MARTFSIDAIRVAASVVVCLAAGAVGSLFTTPKIAGWYATLAKPSFRPPNWVFGPVWTMLYILMGIALFLVWRKGLSARGVRAALLVFVVQLVLNALWSVAFFGAESPGAGLVVIVALWFAIVACIALFAPLSRAAALLLVPYILWVSFAAILNGSIYLLNR